jgi:GDSL-like Lipase/Acylhydrolase family
MSRRCTGVVAALVAGVLAWSAPVAGAVVPAPATFVVRAIGDSVTAGFGYCGAADPACSAGYLNPATALLPCVRATYLDACSANLGAYPSVGELFGPAPALPANPVSWADQFAAREGMSNYVNMAVTGSTPAEWGAQGTLHGRLAQVIAADTNLTLMTLGANPVLRAFYTSFSKVACLFSLNPLESEARLLAKVHRCTLDEFDRAHSGDALRAVYRELLEEDPSNHVLVLEYHTPWPVAFPLRHYVRTHEVQEIIRTLNEQIARAVADVAPDFPGRLSLVATPPWREDHQCLAQPPAARWVIDLDFCIHPSRAGYTQLMDEVVNFARANPQALGFASAAWVS